MVNDEKNVAGSNQPGETPGSPIPQPDPQHAAQPAPASPSSSGEGDARIQSDMSHILKSIKLPERRNYNEPAPQKRYDTKQPGSGVSLDQAAAPQTPAPAPRPDTERPPTVAEIALGLTHKRSSMRPMHTLKDDLQHVVKEQKISLVRAVALEEQKRARKPVAGVGPRKQPRRWGFTIFLSATFVGLGLMALAAVFVVMQERAGGNVAFPTSLIFAEQAVPLPIDLLAPNDIRRSLAGARESAVLTLGAILQIVPTKNSVDPQTRQTVQQPVPFGEFLQATGINPPDELLRSIGSDFFIGIHTVDENAPVIVTTITSYERAFAGMLAWEKEMNADLSPFFSSVPRHGVGLDGLPIVRQFEDSVMRNYDVRVLKDDTGAIQLYYSFPTRDILIIAESPYSFTEILSRLRADRRL